jgi:hypothetical protein
MSDTVFIMGAGTSKPAGAPLMDDFLDRAEQLLRTGVVHQAAAEFNSVFEAIGKLQAVHSKSRLDIKNIEAVLTTFEMARTLGKFPGYDDMDSIEQLIGATKTLIVRTLENTIEFPVDGGHVIAPSTHGLFAKLLHHMTLANPVQTVSILTFNYDILFETAFYADNIECRYGLDYDSQLPGIPLLKLHGSINWALNKKTNQILPWTLFDYINYLLPKGELDRNRDWVRLPIGSNIVGIQDAVPDSDIDAYPVLIPPTWNKAFYHERLFSVWNQAAIELGEAENIVVIGYSLPETDGFFRSLYSLGTVSERPLKRFWVFNPDDSGKVEERFRSLLGPGAEERFEYKPVGFDEAVGILWDHFGS